MNAPLIWILLPGSSAILLYLLRRWKTIIHLAGSLICVVFSFLAWRLPIDEVISLNIWGGFPAFRVGSTFTVLGRQFVLANADRPMLMVIYFAAAFWFSGASIAKTSRQFVPLGLAIAALLTATLAVKPFLYAALFIEMVIMLCVPLLAPPGASAGRGVIRFLTLMSLGAPFILFSGWQFSGIEANPENNLFVLRALISLGLGFALLLAIFPFQTWVPMLAEEANPFIAGFVFFALPSTTGLFLLNFLSQYVWLRQSQVVQTALVFMGCWMVFISGAWALFQTHAGRILGYAVLMEIGNSILMIGLYSNVVPSSQLLGLYFVQLAARCLALALWAQALAMMKNSQGSLHFSSLGGIGRSYPIASAALLIAHFTTAGLPLLANFPHFYTLWTTLSSFSTTATLVALAGQAGLLLAGLRTTAAFLSPSSKYSIGWKISERRQEIVWLGCVASALVLIGLLPKWFLFPLGGL